MVGVNEDAQNVLPSKLQESGNVLYLLGDTYSEFGGSLYLKNFMEKLLEFIQKLILKKS